MAHAAGALPVGLPRGRRQHHRQRGASEPEQRPRCLHHAAAVDRGRLQPGLRRAAACGWRSGGPAGPQGRDASGAGVLRSVLAPRGTEHLNRPAHRCACAHGDGCSLRLPGNPGDLDVGVHEPLRAAEGSRHLGGHLRSGGGVRSHHRWCTARALLVRLDLSGQHPARPDHLGPWSDPHPEDRPTPSASLRHPRGAHLDPRGHFAGPRHHPRSAMGMVVGDDAGVLRRRRRHPRDLRPRRATDTGAPARRKGLRHCQVLGRRHGHRRLVLLPVRVHLLDHPVLPIRQGLFDLVSGRAHAALRHRLGGLHPDWSDSGAQGRDSPGVGNRSPIHGGRAGDRGAERNPGCSVLRMDPALDGVLGAGSVVQHCSRHRSGHERADP